MIGLHQLQGGRGLVDRYASVTRGGVWLIGMHQLQGGGVWLIGMHQLQGGGVWLIGMHQLQGEGSG